MQWPSGNYYAMMIRAITVAQLHYFQEFFPVLLWYECVSLRVYIVHSHKCVCMYALDLSLLLAIVHACKS